MFLAAVLEYMTAEVVELAGDAARRHKRRRITPAHIFEGVHNDGELHALLRSVCIAGGGVLPNIHAVLQRKGKTTGTTKDARDTEALKL